MALLIIADGFGGLGSVESKELTVHIDSFTSVTEVERLLPAYFSSSTAIDRSTGLMSRNSTNSSSKSS